MNQPFPKSFIRAQAGAVGMATNAASPPLDIRDERGLVPVGPDWIFWLWVWLGILAGLILLLGLLAWWWRRRNRPPSLPPAEPPQVRARRLLGHLEGRLHEPEPFCTGVSSVIRQFLEDQHQLRAPERTTEEFLAEARDTPHLNDAQRTMLADFLVQCDLVKFACNEPPETELRNLLTCARRLVEETGAPNPPLPEAQPAS